VAAKTVRPKKIWNRKKRYRIYLLNLLEIQRLVTVCCFFYWISQIEADFRADAFALYKGVEPVLGKMRFDPYSLTIDEATMKTILHHASLACGLLLITATTNAELVNFEVVEVESPYFDGRSFGNVGQYEMITARATFGGAHCG
jgi:hypothetical protein